jgi:putative hydrolase of the HAD superfamily
MDNLSIDWNEIDTVCLDMDGTVLDLHFDNHFWLDYIPKIYAQENQLSLEKSEQLLTQKTASVKGQLEWYCLDFWSKELGLDIAAHKAEIAHLIAPRAGAIEFLEFVKKSGKQQLLVTNAHRDSLNLKIATIDIKQYFHHLISSHDYGMAKEQPGFWKQLLKHHPIDLSRTLFIDDSNNVLEAAQQAGIKYVLDIAKPDSKKPAKPSSNFPQLQHFSDIINYA